MIKLDDVVKFLGNRIVIKPDVEVKSGGGIILTDEPMKIPNTGEIMAIGISLKIDLKIGDKVIYQKNEGQEAEYKGEKVILAKDDIIMAIINN